MTCGRVAWRPRIWLVIVGLAVLVPPTVVMGWSVPADGSIPPGAPRSTLGPFLGAIMGPAIPGVDGRVTLDAGRRTLSLHGDGAVDLALVSRSVRVLLEAYRPGHLIDLGRWKTPIGSGPERRDWVRRQIERLPSDERVALRPSGDARGGAPLRRLMPLAAGHLYLAGMHGEPGGRGRVLALLEVERVNGEQGIDERPVVMSAGRDLAVTLAVSILEQDGLAGKPDGEHEAPAPSTRGDLARAGSGDRAGYVQLYGLARWGEPARAGWRFPRGSGIGADLQAPPPEDEGDRPAAAASPHVRREAPGRAGLTSPAADLVFGLEGQSLDVRITSQDRSLIRRLSPPIDGDLWEPRGWVRRTEAEEGASYLLRVRDRSGDELVRIEVAELDETAARLAFSWRLVDDRSGLESLGYRMVEGRVRSEAGQPLEHFLVWVQSDDGLLDLPFAQRSDWTSSDGRFVLPVVRGATTIVVWGSGFAVPGRDSAASAAGSPARHLAVTCQAIQLAPGELELVARPAPSLSLAIRTAAGLAWSGEAWQLDLLGPGGLRLGWRVAGGAWRRPLDGMPAGGYRAGVRGGVPGSMVAPDGPLRDAVPVAEEALYLMAGSAGRLELWPVPTGGVRARLSDASSGRTIKAPAWVVAPEAAGWLDRRPVLGGRLALDGLPLERPVSLRLVADGYRPLELRLTPTPSGYPERDLALVPE